MVRPVPAYQTERATIQGVAPMLFRGRHFVRSFPGATVTEGDTNLGLERRRWNAGLDAAGDALLAADADVFLHQALSTPCLNVLTGASGSELIDASGKRFLDFHGNCVHQVGYQHPTVVNAVVEQLQTLPFCPRRYTNAPAVELAQRLISASGRETGRVLFTPSGSASIGVALNIARLATGRYKVLSMWDSFHGASLDTVSAGGESHFRQSIGPLLPGAEHVPPYDPQRCPLGCHGVCNQTCASYAEYVLEHEGDIAALIVEPIRATTASCGPREYWQRLRDACDRTGTWLIFDEIPTCLGRTGFFYSGEHTGVQPDLTVLGKGLGGAVMPIAATVIHRDWNEAAHTSLGHFTHEKSPLGSAAALATLDVIRDEGLLERSQTEGAWFREALSTAIQGSSLVKEIRGSGLLTAVELASSSAASEILFKALEAGLSFKVSASRVLVLTPPLNISREHHERALNILTACILGSSNETTR